MKKKGGERRQEEGGRAGSLYLSGLHGGSWGVTTLPARVEEIFSTRRIWSTWGNEEEEGRGGNWRRYGLHFRTMTFLPRHATPHHIAPHHTTFILEPSPDRGDKPFTEECEMLQCSHALEAAEAIHPRWPTPIPSAECVEWGIEIHSPSLLATAVTRAVHQHLADGRGNKRSVRSTSGFHRVHRVHRVHQNKGKGGGDTQSWVGRLHVWIVYYPYM